MHRSKDFTVSLVGAGPGDPELITLKGLKAIQSADVILYDALATKELLSKAREGCECIYVGKRCGRHSLKQQDIHALILQKSKTHHHLVRLKGGNPFVFGRGHEEMTFLENNGITVTVIPGISSATSLPLLQGIPLTKRDVSESFWVITGTTKDHKISKDIYLAAQSRATVVILMGMRKLEEICQIFQSGGRAAIPAMVISKGSTPEEKVAVGTVRDIYKKVQELQLESPGLIIIGDVVGLKKKSLINQAIETWL